jgi:hypothetical protein
MTPVYALAIYWGFLASWTLVIIIMHIRTDKGLFKIIAIPASFFIL